MMENMKTDHHQKNNIGFCLAVCVLLAIAGALAAIVGLLGFVSILELPLWGSILLCVIAVLNFALCMGAFFVFKKMTKKGSLGQKARNMFADGAIYFVLAVLGILWVLPIAFLVYTAFRVTPNTGIINKLFPDDLKLGFRNFYVLFTETQFGLWLRNTFIVATCSCLITTLFILMVSYSFSRMRFKMRKPLMNVMLILNMFPGFMSMIAIYFILKAMGLTNTLTALVLVYSGSAGMGYYICKGFFDTIPRSLEEAATLDGASQWTIFWRITIPLSKPIIIYTVLTAFMGPWCDFIFAKLIINNTSPELFTVAIGLYNLINADKGSFNTWFTVFCAGSVIVGAINVILFLSMQKYYVAGVSQGAVK